MNFIAGIVTGALLALVSVWYVRNTDGHTEGEQAKEPRSNEREEHDRFVKEQQRQFDKLMQYTGKDQRA